MHNRYSKFGRYVINIGTYREIFHVLTKHDNLTAENVFGKIENLESSKCADVVGLESQDVTLIAQRDVIFHGTLLHAAAAVGCRKIAHFMLENGADVECRCVNGFTPLHYAVKWNQIELIEFLLDRRADVHAVTRNRITPLHLAAALGSTESLTLLLSVGARAWARDSLLNTPLHLAVNSFVKGTIVKNVALLLSFGSQVNAVDHVGNTPLHRSILKTDSAMVLEGSLTDPDEKDSEYEGRRIARLNKDPVTKKVVKLLLNNGAFVNFGNGLGERPLHLAIVYSTEKVVRTLVQRGANTKAVDGRWFTPLQLLYRRVEFNREEIFKIIKILVRNGAHVSPTDIERSRRTRFISPTEYIVTDECRFIAQRSIERAVVEEPYGIKPPYYKNSYFSHQWDETTVKIKREFERLGDINDRISFQSFLGIKNANELALFLQNKSVLSKFDVHDWETDYPILGQHIKEQYEKGVNRLKLLKKGEENLAKLFHRSTGHPKLLPSHIGRKIVLYLTDNEIKRVNQVARKYC